MSAADRLRHAVALLRQAGDADALATAADIDRYLAGAASGLTLDIALGVSPASGQTPWWEAERRETRDRAIRELREHHFSDLKIGAAARAIAQEASCFQASTWRHGTVAISR